MNKTVTASLILLCAISGFFTLCAEPANTAARVIDPSKGLAARMRSYGGDIIDRRHQKGEFFVINAQNAASPLLLTNALAAIAKDICVDGKLETGVFDMTSPSQKGQATLFVIDDDKLPLSLVAVEAKWAAVNVAKLKTDKTAFFEARVKKEMYRTVGQLFGAFSNQFEANIYGPVFSAEDLDQIVSTTPPFEYRKRFEKYIPALGIVPYKVVHYRKAVMEGWAPAPTNEFQKAVWDKVHAMPKNPMKIEFDPKKGR